MRLSAETHQSYKELLQDYRIKVARQCRKRNRVCMSKCNKGAALGSIMRLSAETHQSYKRGCCRTTATRRLGSVERGTEYVEV